MRDEKKTKAELIAELKKLRRRAARLERPAGKAQVAAAKSVPDRSEHAGRDLWAEAELSYCAQFENSPVPLQIWDFSAIKEYLQTLVISGEKDFRGYFRKHPDRLMECVSLLKILEVNARVPELFKAKSKEDLIRNADKTFSDECYQVMIDAFCAIHDGALYFRFKPHKALTMDRDEIFIITEYSVVPGYETSFGRVLISQVDITERKKVEEELLNSQERFRSIMDSLDALVYVADMDTHEVLYVNEYARKAFGNVIGKRCWESMQSGQQGPCEFCSNRYLLNPDGTPAGPYRWEFRNTQNGRWYFITDRAIRWNDGRVVRMEIATDITDRKRIEEKLIESEELFRSIIETEPECVKMLDRQGRILMMNPSGLRMIDAESAEMVRGQVVYGLVDPEYRDAFGNMIKEVFEGNESTLVFRMTGLKGRSLWLDTISAPLRDESGKVTALLGVTRDITEQKKMEESLKESASILRESQEIGRIGSYVLDILTGTWESSETLDEIFGIDEEFDRSMEGWVSLIHPDWKDAIRDYFVHGVIEKRGIFDKEYKVVRKSDGAERWLHGMGRLELNDDGRPVRMIGTIQDISDRKKMEMDMARMKNLESLGILAGGIAHDFNNLLAGIVGNVSLAQMKIHDRDYVARKLSEVEAVSMLAQKLTHQLLTFSKGGTPVLEEESIDRIIRSSVLFALSGSNINSVFLIEDDLWPVEVDEGQMSQVFSNMVINAREAMPEGGTITVRAVNVELDNEEVGDLGEGRYVKITVEDQGVGIAHEDLPRIFDPYFSTKERGAEKGTGLGLAICFSIIQKHGGYIEVESGQGKGSSFHIFLPASEKETSGKKKQAVPGKKETHGKRILVMDDDKIVRSVAKELLLSFGYRVDLAENGDEAIQIFRDALKRGRYFDAVLLDLTVPGGMGGQEAITELKKIDPDVRAVIVSGYTESSVVSNYWEYGFSASLIKPFKAATLRDVLKNVLALK